LGRCWHEPLVAGKLTAVSTKPSPDAKARTFVIVTTPAALAAWQVGFELGAFDVIAYRRVFAVFVVSAVVLIATFILPDGGFATSAWSRLILSLPLVYLAADIVFLTESTIVATVLGGALLLTLPYAAWVAARLMGFEFFSLARREQVAAVALVVLIGVLGWYVGRYNNHFLTCRDFVRMGDFEPANCAGRP
jgi:hypothetical protein